MDEIALNPDRELSEAALAMGLLVTGRTTLDNFSWTRRSRAFAEQLREFGLSVEDRGRNAVLTGVGFSYKVPVLLRLPESDFAMSLLFALASKDSETLYTVTGPENRLERAKDFLKNVFAAVFEESPQVDGSFSFHFAGGMPVPRETREGCIPYLAKNAALLNALVTGKNVTFEEKSTVRSEFVEILAYFGAKIEVQTTGNEEMSELERRLAKARGIKTERRIRTTLSETKVLTGRDYFVPADPTEAAAFATLHALSPAFKGKKAELKNVLISADRAGVFSALRRMGAKIEVGSRHERYGTAFANITTTYGGRLSSRRLGEDILCTCLEEYPFIALAACTAEGESILRIPDSLSKELRPLCESLARNLKQTGASIGVYEEGLVVRGREGLDAGTFDAAEDPVLELVFSVLSLFSQGDSTIENGGSAGEAFPGILEQLKEEVAE